MVQVRVCCLTPPIHYLYQCWLIAWARSSDIHLRAFSQEIPQPSITKVSLKITYWNQSLKWSNLSFKSPREHFDGLVQERHNSIANALELRLSCTNPTISCFGKSPLVQILSWLPKARNDCLFFLLFPGSYCPEGSVQPIPCPPGQYCPSYELGTPFGDCLQGYFCNGSASQPDPVECSTGYYCPTGTPNEEPCPPGTFSGKWILHFIVAKLEDFYLIPSDLWGASDSTHSGLVTPYGNEDLGQHWLR